MSNYTIVDAYNAIAKEITPPVPLPMSIDHIEQVGYLHSDWYDFRAQLFEDGVGREPTFLHGIIGLHVNRDYRYFRWDAVADHDYETLNREDLLVGALVANTRNKA